MRYFLPQLTPVLDFVAPHSLDSCVRLLQQQNQPSGRLLVSLFPVDDNSCRFEVMKRHHRRTATGASAATQRRVEGYLWRIDHESTKVTAEAPKFFPRYWIILIASIVWPVSGLLVGQGQSVEMMIGFSLMGVPIIILSILVNYFWQRDQAKLTFTVQELLGAVQQTGTH